MGTADEKKLRRLTWREENAVSFAVKKIDVSQFLNGSEDMSLLTHDECPHYFKGGCSAMGGDFCRGDDCNWLAEIRSFHAKTLKAVAEWGDGYRGHRTVPIGRPVDSPPKLRRTCSFCISDLLRSASEGKMPGEE